MANEWPEVVLMHEPNRLKLTSTICNGNNGKNVRFISCKFISFNAVNGTLVDEKVN